jgi:hypothetical protein
VKPVQYIPWLKTNIFFKKLKWDILQINSHLSTRCAKENYNSFTRCDKYIVITLIHSFKLICVYYQNLSYFAVLYLAHYRNHFCKSFKKKTVYKIFKCLALKNYIEFIFYFKKILNFC